MRIAQEKVFQFHEKHGFDRAETPRLVPFHLAFRRHGFMQEELEEYVQAVHQEDLVGIADALGDLLYVVLGTAVTHGIDLEPVFEEIHRSNMTKTPMDPATKKGSKGPGYEPPQLAAVLLKQTEAFSQADGVR